MSEYGAQKNLKTSIAPDVVKRAPYDVRFLVLAFSDGRRQTCQAMHEHFRRAGRTRSQKHPLGGTTLDRRISGSREVDAARDAYRNAECAPIVLIVIGDHRVHAGCGND